LTPSFTGVLADGEVVGELPKNKSLLFLKVP